MFTPLSDTLVIGIGHRSRHGKDQAARFIRDGFPQVDIVRFGFADALKAVCRVQWGMTAKDGSLLQRVGVAMRSIDEDIWVRALYWAIVERRPEVALITDMRFQNEVAMVRAVGGLTVKVDRRDAAGRPFRTSDRDPNHESETALEQYDDWDAVIENPEGELHAFERHTLSAFEALTAKRDNELGVAV